MSRRQREDERTTEVDFNNAHVDDDDKAEPSRFFVPYTGRYYIHFLLRNAKGTAGHNMRFMLHSNGLCVVCLDLSNILVVSQRNLRRSAVAALPPPRAAGATALRSACRPRLIALSSSISSTMFSFDSISCCSRVFMKCQDGPSCVESS